MEKNEKKLDLTTEAVKQQITLASATITFVLAFAKNIADATGRPLWKYVPWALAPFALAVAFGVVVLMSLAYYLPKMDDAVKARPVRILGALQNLSFITATVIMVWIIWKIG